VFYRGLVVSPAAPQPSGVSGIIGVFIDEQRDEARGNASGGPHLWERLWERQFVGTEPGGPAMQMAGEASEGQGVDSSDLATALTLSTGGAS
jgi:hypothetical protein